MQNELRTLTATDLRNAGTTQVDLLGAIGYTADGRQYVYVSVGASAVGAGQLLVTPAVVTNHQGLSLATNSSTAAGSNSLMVTLGATAATQNQYGDGYVTVVTGTGHGYAYKVRGNALAASSGTMQLDLYQDEALIAGLDNTSTLNLAANPYANLITSTTASHSVGVASAPIPANGFGWAQTYGYCSVLIQGSISKGVSVSQSTTTAGALAVFSSTNAILGNTLEACSNTQYNSIWLQIT